MLEAVRLPVLTTARYLAALGATALLVAGVSACATTPSSSVPSSAKAKPSTLTIATSFSIGDLDPIENGYWGNELGYGELLMRPQPDGTVKPWLLKSLANTSPTTWVLTLNSPIRFQDGKPLNAAALIACMQYQLKQNSSATAALPGARLTATGTDQVTVTTTRPVPNMPYILGDESFFIIYDQAAYLTAKGSPAKLIAAKIYTGPYVVTDANDQIMHEVRNPIYWDGTPRLSEVTVKFITDAQSRILAVEHGEADLALYPPTTAAKTLTGRTDAYYDTGTPRGPTFQLFLNEHTAPFNDVAVRRAVQAGIDYDQLASQVMNGLYKPATGMYASTAPYALTTQVTSVSKAMTCSPRTAGPPAPPVGYGTRTARPWPSRSTRTRSSRTRRPSRWRSRRSCPRSASTCRSAACPTSTRRRRTRPAGRPPWKGTGRRPSPVIRSRRYRSSSRAKARATRPASTIRSWTA